MLLLQSMNLIFLGIGEFHFTQDASQRHPLAMLTHLLTMFSSFSPFTTLMHCLTTILVWVVAIKMTLGC
jgi:hypothetical protein